MASQRWRHLCDSVRIRTSQPHKGRGKSGSHQALANIIQNPQSKTDCRVCEALRRIQKVRGTRMKNPALAYAV